MRKVVDSNLIIKVTERFIELQLIESPESEIFIKKLIERQIITFETMRNYIIIKDYDAFLKANKGNILWALEDFEEDYKICTRQVRKIHKKYTRIY